MLLIAVAALCGMLGKWQMWRAEEQRALQLRAAAAERLPELDLDTASPGDEELFRHAAADGTYDAGQQFYLSGRSHDEQPGYHVITPLRLAGTRRYLLVNRGWMPGEVSSAPVPVGRVHVSGVLARAQMPALRLGNPAGAVRTYVDPEEYARESGRSVEPFILLARNEPSLVPVAETRDSKLAMHVGYALQWFAFACLAAGAAGLLFVRELFYGE